MEKANGSSETGFLLLGLSEDPTVQKYLFVIFLVAYLITLSGNIILIIACACDPHLRTPMYFFIVNLSFIDVCCSTTTVPNMLAQLIARKRISFYACAAQLCSFVFFGGTECFILAVMAFDRFVAISFALRYNAIMNKHVCIAMAAFSWVCSGLCAIMYVAITLQLPFCTQNVIKHFFCELIPLLTIACADITITQRVLMVTGSVFQLLMPLLVVLFSYFCIFVTIIGIPSSRGRYKAFSTCTSHLIVITVTIGPAVFMYLKPAYKNSEHQDKLFSVFYTVGSPAVNPIIYSLRNKDVKKALQKLPKKYRFI